MDVVPYDVVLFSIYGDSSPLTISVQSWLEPIYESRMAGHASLAYGECARAFIGCLTIGAGEAKIHSYAIEDILSIEAAVLRAIAGADADIQLCDGAIKCMVSISGMTVDIELSDRDQSIWDAQIPLPMIGGEFFAARCRISKSVGDLASSGWWNEPMKRLLSHDF